MHRPQARSTHFTVNTEIKRESVPSPYMGEIAIANGRDVRLEVGDWGLGERTNSSRR